MRSSWTAPLKLALVAVGGCNAILGISEHHKASATGSAGIGSAARSGGNASGGMAGASGVGAAAGGGKSGGRAGSSTAGAGVGGSSGGGEAGGAGTVSGNGGGAPTGGTGTGDAGAGDGGVGNDAGATGTGGSSGSGSAVAECVGKKSGDPVCHGQDAETCDPGLATVTVLETCVDQACVDGACVGTCEPGTSQCSGNSTKQCGTTGAYADPVACPAAKPACAGSVCASPPSCQPALANCGSAGTESCCVSSAVTGTQAGDTFYLSFDDDAYPGKLYPATVSDFRLDRFEITVARFRRFASAWTQGWRPANGDGKHAYLHGGAGLFDGDGPDFEQGWDSTWGPSVTPDDTHLACDSSYQTWTADPGANDARPIVCENWFEAYAFCIWDGGFLPSEAEWNYAAAGGIEQRAYPWTTSAIDCSYANYSGASGGTLCTTAGVTNVGHESPKGDSKYGQADLAGNAWEWTLDYYAGYSSACSDCAYLQPASYRVARGGRFDYDASQLLNGYRNGYPPGDRSGKVGARCARSVN